MPAANRVHAPVDCPVCHKTIGRKADLPRHMCTHDGNKEALMHACPFPNCDYKTLQKSNMQTHIRTHTRERSKTCPHPRCEFATTDLGSLTRHRKQLHGYEPKAHHNFGGRAACQSAAAPYRSLSRPVKAEVEIPASLDLNFDPTFPELSGLIPCSALSPAESSNSGFSSDFTDFSWEQLFPDLSAESFSTVYSQPCQFPVPIPTSKDFQPATVPIDLSTLHVPQHDMQLFSDGNFQCQPVSGNYVNYSQPEIPVLDKFLQKHGSGYFEDWYQYNGTYPMDQPAFTSGYPTY
ncbi:hypothetical protein DFH29DRAFT_1017797 [Suillus ampliporus]|nr:hypothetical protein DFH29DRAFT_1017797 [Suillus ampliporus]